MSASEASAFLGELAEVLVDCVEGGASVSFMPPFGKPAAEEFFRKVIQGVEAGERILLAAFLEAKLAGTVQVRDGVAAQSTASRRNHQDCWFCDPREAGVWPLR